MLILASSSATRQNLLRQAGVVFTALPPAVDEAAVKAASKAGAGILALELASLKAIEISRKNPRAWVIGADQVLRCGSAKFDKPEGLAGAAAQLRMLRGRTHHLLTAVCIYRNGERLWQHLEEPQLNMRDVSDDFIAAYLTAEGEAVCSSVGAYRLEGLGIQLFERIEGDFFTILGLPLLPLLGFLRTAGVLAA